MILHGNSRSGAKALALHLLRTDENEHVQVHEVSGFMASDVLDAFEEADTIAKGTHCKKPLFSLSLSPPKNADVSAKEFEKAIAKTEKALGLAGQPRVVVFHEKGDHRDRHCHVVWSRIDSDEMKAIPLPFNRMKMRDVSRELFIEHGWDVPRGLLNRDERDPLNYTLKQYQQAKRTGRHAKDIKADIQAAWAISDTKAAFEHALKEKGFRLAKGNRRGFVAVDHHGEVYSIPRSIGVKTKIVRERLGSENKLEPVNQVYAKYADDMAAKMCAFQSQLKSQNTAHAIQRQHEKQALIERQRAERKRSLEVIETRKRDEALARQARFRTGLKGLWDWVRGENARIKKENEADALRCKQRDEAESKRLIQKQREQRRNLVVREKAKRENLKQLHKEVAQDRQAFEAKAERSREERREAFKKQRRNQRTHARPRGPER